MINKKIFIEFIGMPASGKSFYQDKIIRLIKRKTFYNKFNKLNKLQKFFFFLVFFIKYFRFTLKNLNFFFFTGINNKEFKKHFYYFKNEAALRILHEYKKENVINSEGFRYRAIYFIYENLKTNKNFSSKDYINLLPKIDLLIYIKSNKRQNILRSKKRKKGFRYNLEETNIYSDKEKIIRRIINQTKKNSFFIEFKNNKFQENMTKFQKIIKKI